MLRSSGSTSISGARTSPPPMACFRGSQTFARNIWLCIRKSLHTGPRRRIAWALLRRDFVMSAPTCARHGLGRTTRCAHAAREPTFCRTIQSWIWIRRWPACSAEACGATVQCGQHREYVARAGVRPEDRDALESQLPCMKKQSPNLRARRAVRKKDRL